MAHGGHRPRILVTDAAERSVIAVCRGLHARDYGVSAAAFARFAPSHWSRCCSERLRIPDPRDDVMGFISELRRVLERRPYAGLIPGSDRSLLAVSRERRRLEGLTRIGLPPHDTVTGSFNRERLAEAAHHAGLAPAKAVRCRDAADALEAARELGYPVVLKSISTARDLGARIVAGELTQWVSDDSALRASLAEYRDAWLVQRVLTGPTISFAGVTAEGRLLGAAVSQYRRTWPPPAGNATFSTTIAPTGELVEQVSALVRHLGWEGMFELELIETSPGHLTPIDFNPRPYGSLALAVAAGANLPALWCDWLLGRGSPATLVLAQPGRTYRWEDADLRHLAWQLRHGKLTAAARVARPWRGTVHPHFALSDPLPLAARGFTLVAGRISARRGEQHRRTTRI